MESDDEVPDKASPDSAPEASGPHAESELHDDDELANALAADLSRLGSGPIAVIWPTSHPLEDSTAETSDDGPAEMLEEPEPQPEPEPEPSPSPEPEPQPSPAPEPESESGEPTPPPPSGEESAPWMNLPAPDPAQAVVLPDVPPHRPVRQSLADAEILGLASESPHDGASTLELIEQLEAQLQLRDQEAREFSAWESNMVALGTPDAIAAVEDARTEFSDVLPHSPATPPPVSESRWAPAPSSDPVPPWAPPATEPEPEPGPELEPEPEVEPVLEPEPEPRVDHVMDPPDDSVLDLDVDSEPEPAIVEPEIVEPESEPEIVEPEIVELEIVEPESEPEIVVEPELGAPPAAPFAPPPLVEPPVFVIPVVAPVVAGAPQPVDTGSIPIDRAFEKELDDDVDETDRVSSDLAGGPVAVDNAGTAGLRPLLAPPSGPISTVRVPEDEVVIVDNEPVRQRVFSLEESGVSPTPVDRRVGRAARLFWLWFAANSSILSFGLGAAIFALGISLRQSIVAVLAGVALSFIPLGLTTLAGKRSGQPTMIVSRATFGVVGNVIPAALALLTRLFWGAVLLWLLASSVAIVLVGAALDGALGDRQLLLISLAVSFLVALLIAFAGYPLIARVQLILSIITGALVVGLILFTARFIDISAALTTQDGPWLLTVTGAVLVFSFVGLVWANSGGDLARYQRPGTNGGSSMLWATFGTTLPSFVLIGYGALLAASNESIANGFLLSPLDTLTLMLPSWYPVPLIAAATLSLLSGVILSLYSGGFALQAVGVRVPRQWSIVIVGVILGALALVLSFGVPGGVNELFRDLATTLAVPTAAWAGIFAAEMMIRNRRFESQSLTTRGGVYPDVRWVNLVALVLITAVGFAFTSATIGWLSWQGFGFGALGVSLDTDLAGTDLGVLAALVLGLLTPIVAGIPAIRRQESTEV